MSILTGYVSREAKKIDAYVDYSGSADAGAVRAAVREIITAANALDIAARFTFLCGECGAPETTVECRDIDGAVDTVMENAGSPRGSFYIQDAFRAINKDAPECAVLVTDMVLNIMPEKEGSDKLYVLEHEGNPECLPEHPGNVLYMPLRTPDNDGELGKYVSSFINYMDQRKIYVSNAILPAVGADYAGAYRFSISCTADISAGSIAEALKILNEKFPGCEIKSVKDPGGDRLARTFSEETMDTIWYKPGCLCGYTDCIFDPMEKVAKACARQSDLTPDKYVECEDRDPESEYCDYYDDECK